MFWRRSLWERAGGRLDQRLKRTADFDLWLRFFRLAPFYHVQTVLGGFRVHGDRLGDSGAGEYGRDATRLHADFVAGHDRKALARARLVRALGSRHTTLAGDLLCKAGVLPWYKHPRVVFDFDSQSWSVR